MKLPKQSDPEWLDLDHLSTGPKGMARARTIIETSEEILFINRPLPPENVDLILYVEDQITELLLPDETLADTIYRFAENSDDIIIAVARNKTLMQKPLTSRAGTICYRIPSAIDLWIKAKTHMQPDALSLVFGKYGDHAFLVCANSLSVQRVFHFKIEANSNLERDLLLAVEKLQKLLPHQDPEVPLKLFCLEPLSNPVLQVLRRRSIEYIERIGNNNPQIPGDKEFYEQWDFRLDSEIHEQSLGHERKRVLLVGIISIATAFALWLLLFGTNEIIANYEARTTVRWQELRSSLKEITYLQKQLRQSIGEIMLCKTLSEKRTRRAVILEKIAMTRPQELLLEQIRIGERRKRIDKSGAAAAGEDAVFLKGGCVNGARITEWMDLLVKTGVFSGVTMVSMERKNNSYHFQIECTIRM